MNQILVTEKIYVTPELRKKKKMYRLNFILSIVIIILLALVYALIEYDKVKGEEISKEILSGVDDADTTTVNADSGILLVALNSFEDSSVSVAEEMALKEQVSSTKSSGTYVAANGNTYSTVGEINIPSINVNYKILSETTDALLKVSVCKFWGCDPNEVGNLCIAGHNYRNKRFFSKVLDLKEGDIIEITDLNNNTLQYEVYTTFTVDPSDKSCTSQKTGGEKRVTLITCTNDSQQRVIVQAREKK